MFYEESATDLVAVGAVDELSARLWLRAREPGTHALELWPESRRAARRVLRFEVPADSRRDGTLCLRYPHDFPGAPPLEPGTRHCFAMLSERGARLLGEGSFQTAPNGAGSAGDRFSLALMSCHQPFAEDGRPHGDGITMLRMLDRAFRERNVTRVLLLGDQMYSDYPKRFSLFSPSWFSEVAPRGRRSLFDCSRDEIRSLYHARYRAFWAMPEYRHLLAHWPSQAIPDDHELIDNFGSDPEHATERWRAIHDGALDACHDYQSSRVLGTLSRPESLHFSFEFGPVAGFVLDLRSQRVATGDRVRIYGASQLLALSEFLAKNARRAVIYVGLSVPLVHVPNWVANAGVGLTGTGGDAADRWEFENARESRDALVRLLANHRRQHPDQILVLLGGDIHTGVVSSLTLADSPSAYQVVSSAVTNVETAFHRGVAKMLTRLQHDATTGEGEGRCEARLLSGERGARQNPYSGLNVGILEHHRVGENEWGVRVELIGCQAGTDEPNVVFSQDLGCARAG